MQHPRHSADSPWMNMMLARERMRLDDALQAVTSQFAIMSAKDLKATLCDLEIRVTKKSDLCQIRGTVSSDDKRS